ncbi:MAG TPA: translesion error-prone DNA polymerase V autoproteolytic subunit [Oscillatoriales cyanobacterium M59_W2019_021]|nr:MAG: DNA polymerase V [Cyanobacteria bacterium J055]HIK33360.1 translesion error-prone DNA polymerase V autoproteolytic subunit [Oscillatoriales cyanobacterium M4454_W2019_049]HIK52392.1 translesion error-prone DNA polymerase V autoproteolytic subunit [Oscillatoriales cyanobacterium M59_W2019_021]
MGRGGKRPGAGRPPGTGKYGEPTKAVRLPMSLAEQVTEILERWHARGKSPQVELEIKRICQPLQQSSPRWPMYLEAVAAGSPTPATDYVDEELDLYDHLTQHPDRTFCVRVNGDSMIGAGIHPHDLLVVDAALEPRNGNVAIAVVNGEVTVKRLKWKGDRLFLIPENPNYQPLEIVEEMSFQVLGVVTNVIHSL